MVVPAGSFGAFATVDGTGNITSYTYAAANIFDGTGTLTGTGSNSNVLYVGGSTLNVGVGSTSTTLINTMLMNEQGTTARNININGTLTFNAGGGLFHADDGVATLTIAGTCHPVRVRLAGHLDPIDGHYHWQGTVFSSPAQPLPAETLKRERTVTVTVGERSAPARIIEQTPWGTHSVAGVGAPPYTP